MVAAMTASSFSSVSISVAVGLRPLIDVTLDPARDSMIASRDDMADSLLLPVG